MSYDTKCYILAAFFLDDEPGLDAPFYRDKLAQEIQTTIEDWIAGQVTAATEPQPDAASQYAEKLRWEREKLADDLAQPQAPESLMVERHDYREDTYAIGSDYRPQPQAPEERK